MLLFSPDQAMHGLYPFPVHHMYDTYAMIDIERPDDDLWPKCRQVWYARKWLSLVRSSRE